MPQDSPAQPVSQDAIVETALSLMAERGLAAVSLRRVASELGVSAPTLYWHITGKRELLDRMAEQLVRRGRTGTADRPAAGQPWWEWLHARCRAMFEAMIAVPDGPLLIAGNRPTSDGLAGIDVAIGELVQVGFPAAEAQQVFLVLGGYLGGMALEWQSEATREEPAPDPALLEALRSAEDYPHLSAAFAAGSDVTDHRATFDYGLSLLIRGIRARHAELG